MNVFINICTIVVDFYNCTTKLDVSIARNELKKLHLQTAEIQQEVVYLERKLCHFKSWPSHHFPPPTGAFFPQFLVLLPFITNVHVSWKETLWMLQNLQIGAVCKYCYLFLLAQYPDLLPLQVYSSPPCFILSCFCIIWLWDIRDRKHFVPGNFIAQHCPSTVPTDCRILWLPNTWATEIVFLLLLCYNFQLSIITMQLFCLALLFKHTAFGYFKVKHMGGGCRCLFYRQQSNEGSP